MVEGGGYGELVMKGDRGEVEELVKVKDMRGMVMSMGWGWFWMEKRVGFVFMVEEMRRLKVGELEKVCLRWNV